ARVHPAQDGESPLCRHRTQRTESHQGLQHPMTRQTRQRVSVVVAMLLGASPVRAAVVTGPDGKPVRVRPGDSAPPGSTSTASPPAPATPPGAPRPPFPGFPGAAGKRGRPTPPVPGAAATPPTGTPPAGGGTTGVSGSTQLIGDKDFNTCKKFP